MFSRELGKNTTVVAVNLGNAQQSLTFGKAGAPSVAGAVDFFSGKRVDSLPATLDPGEYLIYTITEE